MNLDHVSPKTVRLWAMVDSNVTYTFAIPPIAERFIGLLYRVDRWLGGSAVLPAFDAIHMLFVCLFGVMVSIWVVARLVRPIGIFALVDGYGRIVVSALLLYFILVLGAPRVLLFFVFTEMLGAVAQLWAVYRKPDMAPSPVVAQTRVRKPIKSIGFARRKRRRVRAPSPR